jgi:hypothetical protein
MRGVCGTARAPADGLATTTRILQPREVADWRRPSIEVIVTDDRGAGLTFAARVGPAAFTATKQITWPTSPVTGRV